VTLSEGKKRRLAIAIARLRNPAFLPSKLTSTDIFVITHGLSQKDFIYFLKNRLVVEYGFRYML
jgi:hypothetical protein